MAGSSQFYRASRTTGPRFDRAMWNKAEEGSRVKIRTRAVAAQGYCHPKNPLNGYLKLCEWKAYESPEIKANRMNPNGESAPFGCSSDPQCGFHRGGGGEVPFRVGLDFLKTTESMELLLRLCVLRGHMNQRRSLGFERPPIDWSYRVMDDGYLGSQTNGGKMAQGWRNC